MSAGNAIAITFGGVGFALSVFTYWVTQRRVRPIVICREHRKRHWKDELDSTYWVASVYLTNESGTAAFNVRFGIDMDGRHAPWKHNRHDEKASRINVLRPSERHPATGEADVSIDDRIFWDIAKSRGTDADVDEGRVYWAYYQGPAGDWWYTANPADRTTNFMIKRVRGRHGRILRGNRKLLKSIEEGGQIRREAFREMQEAIEQHKSERQTQDAPSDDELAAADCGESSPVVRDPSDLDA